MTIPTHLTPAELEALLEAARVATPELAIVARLSSAEYGLAQRHFLGIANPATIERLVLMVRELQRDLAEEKRLRAELKQIAQTGIAEVSSVGTRLQECAVHDAVEHFRARVVREAHELATHVAQELTEQSDNPQRDICNYDDYRKGQIQAAVELKELIESLPLVETEGE